MDDHDLLCDEDWLSSSPSHSPSTPDHHEQKPKIHKQGLGFETSCKQECDEAYVMYRQKELCYFPEQGYVDCVLSDNGLMLFRSKAIQWFVKSRIRLNLSFMSVFNAVNYLDRFVSLNHCQVSNIYLLLFSIMLFCIIIYLYICFRAGDIVCLNFSVWLVCLLRPSSLKLRVHLWFKSRYIC